MGTRHSTRCRRSDLAVAAAMLITSAMTNGSSDADVQIGQIKKVSEDATMLRNGQLFRATEGGPVYQNDVIGTGLDATAGITVTDNTVMSADPNSEVSMENYRLDSRNYDGEMLIDIRKSTFSIVSGDITRTTLGAMKVNTCPRAVVRLRSQFIVGLGSNGAWPARPTRVAQPATRRRWARPRVDGLPPIGDPSSRLVHGVG